ncbi:TetR/AcrR family transcriptional regulator [Staphylococcus gallinarum]|uniref:TetR/AcrR family transcriptional regulator n=1 Tax=Staphylococcus gallinarum TaxID=1293 RepID=UPI001E3BF126|nr:TetR/AcrR family transcriptional regulator [Staphylococcus gallinarum]MCD8842816.1 TetR/AcrR family transcriptional regulator [Staphylococcus gallinarum]
MDKRIIATRNKIENSFVELLKRNRFEDLTVERIIRNANVSRGTFYKHYEDKNDVLNKVINNFVLNCSVILKQAKIEVDYSQIFEKTVYSYNIKLLNYFHENRDLILQIKLQGLNQMLDKLLKIQMKNALLENISYLGAGKHEHLEFIVEYVVSGNLGMIYYWLETNETIDDTEIASLSLKMGVNGALRLLE